MSTTYQGIRCSKVVKSACGRLEPAQPGDTVSYCLTISNPTADQVELTFTDLVPVNGSTMTWAEELVNGAVGPGAGSSPAAGPGLVGDLTLPPRSEAIYTIDVVVADDVLCPARMTNAAVLKFEGADGKLYSKSVVAETVGIGYGSECLTGNDLNHSQVAWEFFAGGDEARFARLLDYMTTGQLDLLSIIEALGITGNGCVPVDGVFPPEGQLADPKEG